MFKENKFPQFDYPIEAISRYLAAAGIFTLKLTSGEIINFEPQDPISFEQWLQQYEIENIREEN